MRGRPQHIPGTREGSRGTALSPARPACTPGTGSSDKPLPGPPTTLRPQPAAQHPATHATGERPTEPLDAKRLSLCVQAQAVAQSGAASTDLADLCLQDPPPGSRIGVPAWMPQPPPGP